MCICIHILSKFTNYFVKQLKNDHSSLFKVNLRSFININSKNALSKGVFYIRYYSHSTITNQFCLEIICCHVCISFDYLIYPYYTAYMN